MSVILLSFLTKPGFDHIILLYLMNGPMISRSQCEKLWSVHVSDVTREFCVKNGIYSKGELTYNCRPIQADTYDLIEIQKRWKIIKNDDLPPLDKNPYKYPLWQVDEYIQFNRKLRSGWKDRYSYDQTNNLFLAIKESEACETSWELLQYVLNESNPPCYRRLKLKELIHKGLTEPWPTWRISEIDVLAERKYKK